MASVGSGLRITDAPYSNVPDITAKVFINDAGKLRQTDLDTMVKYSSIYQTVVAAGEEGVANVQATVNTGHEKLLQDISAVDDLRTAVSDINVRLNNLSTAAKDITVAPISGLSATNAQAAIAELQKNVSSCFQSVSDGKSAVATALTNQGVATSATATYATMAANVGVVANNKYNAGIAYADGRVNTNSDNYRFGYNAGVTAADNRVSTSSASYQNGYSAGYRAGYDSGYADGKRVADPGNINIAGLCTPSLSGSVQVPGTYTKMILSTGDGHVNIGTSALGSDIASWTTGGTYTVTPGTTYYITLSQSSTYGHGRWSVCLTH